MREQRTTKLTLNGVFNILKLIPLFTVSSQKVTLSNVVNLNAYFLPSAIFCKICKNIPFSYKNDIFPTLNDDSAAHCPARKKYRLFCSCIGTQLTSKPPPPPPPPREPTKCFDSLQKLRARLAQFCCRSLLPGFGVSFGEISPYVCKDYFQFGLCS